MRVAAEHVDNARARERQHPLAGLLIDKESARRLHERPLVDELQKSLHEIRAEMALWMSHKRPKAARPKNADRLFESLVDRSRSRLEQYPPSRASQRDRRELGIVEGVELRDCHLTAGQNAGAASGRSNSGHQLGQPQRQLRDPHIVVVTDVRRRADRRDAVGLCLLGHRDRVIEIPGTVIESRQEMAVKVDVDANTADYHGLVTIMGRRSSGASMPGGVQPAHEDHRDAGPATDAPGVLDALVAAGMDCARLNCSHGTHEDLRRRVGEVRATAARAGRPIGVLFDLQGPKLRLSAVVVPSSVQAGEVVTFTCSDADVGERRVPVDFPDFPRLVTERSEIVVGDGVPRLVVESAGPGEVVARARSAGELVPRKGINVTYARPELPAITGKDLADLALATDLDVDFVALSFVRSAADIEQLRARLDERGRHGRTIAKIEKVEGYENLDEIIAVADGVMVARGDFGVEAGVARVPLMQKDTILRATHAGKLVITATQMLESMIHAPEPTRAEATDVANAVIDGTSAVMLSAETSIGQVPRRGGQGDVTARRGRRGGT